MLVQIDPMPLSTQESFGNILNFLSYKFCCLMKKLTSVNLGGNITKPLIVFHSELPKIVNVTI